MGLVVDVSTDEWEVAQSMIRYTGDDEHDVLGMLLLTSDGTHRRWYATDSRWLVTEIVASDDRSYDVLVSPRSVTFGLFASRTTGTAQLTVTDNGLVTVGNATEALTISADTRPYPPAKEFAHPDELPESATLVVEAEALAGLLDLATARPDVEDNPHGDPLFWVEVADGKLQVKINWPGLGITEYHLTGTGEGRAATAVPPWQVRAAVRGFVGDITISLPLDGSNPLRIDTPTRTVLMMPIPTGVAGLRGPVESVLSEVFGPDVLHTDQDGDYRLSVRDTPVYARLHDDGTIKLQVFAVVLNNVERTAGLLEELNDHNASFGFARSFWVDGQVLVESDLVAATLDPEELVTSFECVRNIANQIGPMLNAIYGGELLATTADDVWAAYLNTVITAELSPDHYVPLTGPEAVTDWPYQQTVHVVTAFNPYGRPRSPVVNEEANADLGRLLLLNGASFVHAFGSDGTTGSADPDGYLEPSLLVWGLEREDAIALGRRLGQEAVFELDAAELRVIGCDDDRMSSRPRLFTIDSSSAP